MDINEFIRKSFIDGYTKGKKDIIDKACGWLEAELYQHKDREGYPNVESRSYTSVRDLIDDFKKAMEG